MEAGAKKVPAFIVLNRDYVVILTRPREDSGNVGTSVNGSEAKGHDKDSCFRGR